MQREIRGTVRGDLTPWPAAFIGNGMQPQSMDATQQCSGQSNDSALAWDTLETCSEYGEMMMMMCCTAGRRPYHYCPHMLSSDY